MKKLVLTFALSLLGLPCSAATYYLNTAANGGRDSNAGTSAGSPWATPSHAVHCGDTIIAGSANYTGTTSFNFGSWGTVTGTHPCVAFLKCITFATCSVTSNNDPAMFVTTSHWAIIGFVFSQTGTPSANGYACINVTPPSGVLTDFLIADNVFNGCYGGAVSFAGDDYLAFIANVVYNAAQTSVACSSGISVFEPANYDAAGGTHIYVAQNVSYGNVEPNPCNGGTPTDAEGIIFDTWSANSYTGQGVVENNIAMFNGGRGIEVCSNSLANVVLQYNTVYADFQGTLNNTRYLGEINTGCSDTIKSVTVQRNIAQTTVATVNSNRVYAYYVGLGDQTSATNYNVAYSATASYATCLRCTGGLTIGSGQSNINPSFASAPASIPAAPGCGSFASVPACMASIISDFVPSARATVNRGYQPINSTCNHDIYYPQWLVQYSSQLSGLVTQACALPWSQGRAEN
jgi:hypothetical protein